MPESFATLTKSIKRSAGAVKWSFSDKKTKLVQRNAKYYSINLWVVQNIKKTNKIDQYLNNFDVSSPPLFSSLQSLYNTENLLETPPSLFFQFMNQCRSMP